jgi:hypothetical protein
MAERMVCEIVRKMSGIEMQRQPTGQTPETNLDTVYSKVDGDYQLEVWFRAEHRWFQRLAGCLLGEPTEDETDIQESAIEFFNVLCGRFVSELCRTTHFPARLDRPHFLGCAEENGVPEEASRSILHFTTEKQERAEFSWTREPMEQLLIRSGMQ